MVKLGRRSQVAGRGLFCFGKKGEQMTLTTIIVIVLGVVLLVLLIFGFSTGWKNLWDKVTQFGGGSSSNVAAVVQGCALACDAKDKTAFCSQQRTVRTGEDSIPTVRGSCSALSKYSGNRYNIGSCLSLDCPESEVVEN